MGVGWGKVQTSMQATLQADGGQCNMNIDVRLTTCSAVVQVFLMAYQRKLLCSPLPHVAHQVATCVRQAGLKGIGIEGQKTRQVNKKRKIGLHCLLTRHELKAG
jgi:hypothetical protein